MSWQTLAPVLLDVSAPPSHVPALIMGVARVGDPQATRTVYTSVAVLVALGVVLAALAIWVFRRTRPDPELLAPLETMQTRGWRKLDPAAQRRSLDEARPAGAEPMRRATSAPPVDSSFATVAPVASFDDLSDPRSSTDESGQVAPSTRDRESDTDHDTDETVPSDVDAPIDGEDAPGDETAEMPADDDLAADPDDDAAADLDDDAAADLGDDTGEIVDDETFAVDVGDSGDVGDDVVDAIPEAEVVRPIDPLLAPKQAAPDLPR